MKFPQLRRRRLSGTQWLGGPVAYFVVILLRKALEQGAHAVVFGNPQGEKDPVPEPRPLTEEEQRHLADICASAREGTNSGMAAAVEGSTYLKQRGGQRSVAIWFARNGSFRFYATMPSAMYVSTLAAIEELLASIGGSRQRPQPRRYIELGTQPNEWSEAVQRIRQLAPQAPGTPDAGVRRFAEVDWVFAEDNTIRLEILNVREEPEDVAVSYRFC